MLIECGSMKADEKVDSGSVIESSSMVVKTTPAPVPGTSARDNVVSSTVSLNQKMSAPTDKVVSSTVADNLAKALASPKSKAVATVVAAVAAVPTKPVVVVAAAATSTPVVAASSVPVAAAAKQEGKAAKGFYSKRKVVVDDELCPVEEECEL